MGRVQNRPGYDPARCALITILSGPSLTWRPP